MAFFFLFSSTVSLRLLQWAINSPRQSDFKKVFFSEFYISGIILSRINDLVGNPQSPQKTPHIFTHSTEKQTTTLSQEFCEGYLLLQLVRNPHRILAREDWSLWDVPIGEGSSAETAGSLGSKKIVCTMYFMSIF